MFSFLRARRVVDNRGGTENVSRSSFKDLLPSLAEKKTIFMPQFFLRVRMSGAWVEGGRGQVEGVGL